MRNVLGHGCVLQLRYSIVLDGHCAPDEPSEVIVRVWNWVPPPHGWVHVLHLSHWPMMHTGEHGSLPHDSVSVRSPHCSPSGVGY